MHPNMPPDLVTAPPADSVEPAGTYAVVRSAPVPLTLDALEGAPSGALMEGCALVIRSETATDRAGRLYLTLTLRGGDGARFEARWWRYPYPPGQRPLVGQVCRFTGTVDPYQGSPQLSVTRARPEPDMDVARFAHGTRRSEAELVAELERRIVGLDAELAALVRTVLSGEVRERFQTWPAAQMHHGAVRRGLLAHTLRVAELASRLAAGYGPNGLPHDGGLLEAACLLHDVGKVYTLPAVAGAALPKEAAQLDHITLGVLIVRSAAGRAEPALAPARLTALIHAVAAHHGRKEWGAPVEPGTAEAWLLHLADYAESRLWGLANEEAPE